MSQSELPTIECDVAVIGAGHAGCEAALAAARAGKRVLVITPNLDRIGFMPCNPSVGGPGKSHIVAEVDALGGAMAEVSDATALQTRLLNTSKGPAVQAVRHQVDKSLYAMVMKQRLEQQPGLCLAQDEAIGLELGNGAIESVHLRARGPIRCRSVVVTAGTFLRAAMVSGESRRPGARASDAADSRLAENLHSLGIASRRFKTGTPPRVDGRTVNLAKLEHQPGDVEPRWLSRLGRLGGISPVSLPPAAIHCSYASLDGWRPQLACFRTSTNSALHGLIRANLDRAPIFNGMIEGNGPRYCPSIEDKVARYVEKDEHPVFLEPEGWSTSELYVQGMSTSLPFEIQEQALRLLPGLERVAITRFGYAVEYDAVDPNELLPTLESKAIRGLFLAGQVNGTSGYEEAAGQGLLAGLNAARYVDGQQPVTIARTQGYIGVMIDDLVSRPFTEPYRMLTSRAEYRLLLRPETADDRFGQLGCEWAVVDADRAHSTDRDRRQIALGLERFATATVKPNSSGDHQLREAGLIGVTKPMSLAEIMRRPSLRLSELGQILPDLVGPILAPISAHLLQRFEEELKYAAFVRREQREVARMDALGNRPLPDAGWKLPGLRNEARQQIERHQPKTFAEARRIAGITAADISTLLIHATRLERAHK